MDRRASVFDMARPKRRSPLANVPVVEGDLPPAYHHRSAYEIAYDEMVLGTFIELMEPHATYFKRWCRENKKFIEMRRIAPSCWAFRKCK